jgi:hypothetical protein
MCSLLLGFAVADIRVFQLKAIVIYSLSLQIIAINNYLTANITYQAALLLQGTYKYVTIIRHDRLTDYIHLVSLV